MLNSGNPAGLKSIQSSQQAFAVQLQEALNRVSSLEKSDNERDDIIAELNDTRCNQYIELKEENKKLNTDLHKALCDLRILQDGLNKAFFDIRTLEDKLNHILNN